MTLTKWSVTTQRTGNKKTDIKQFDSIKEKKLWWSYHVTASQFYRQKLICFYDNFARQEARIYIDRMLPYRPLAQPEDIESDAILGLIKSVDRFDISRGVNFKVFARSRIRGSIIDGLRLLQNYPRKVAQQKRELKPLVDKLAQQLCHDPNSDEFCLEYGEDYRETIESQLFWSNVYNQSSGTGDSNGFSFNSKLDCIPDVYTNTNLRNSANLTEADQTEAAINNLDLMRLITRILDNQKDSLILTMYYFMGMSNKRIATILDMGISSVVSRHLEAIQVLKNHRIEIMVELEMCEF